MIAYNDKQTAIINIINIQMQELSENISVLMLFKTQPALELL